jgi:hypothetical protein
MMRNKRDTKADRQRYTSPSGPRIVPFVEEETTVTRRFTMLGAIFCLVAMVFFASWPVWKSIKNRPVSASLYLRTKAAVDKNPSLKPAWDIALQDEVLTWPEAKVILESAGEKAEPDQ